MKNLNIPQGYQAVMPYLILKNATDFMAWAMYVLDASEKMKSFRENGTTIAHAEIFIGESTLMIAEASDAWAVNTAGMFVYVTDVDAAYARALERGATSIMPPADQSYGRSCGVTDPFGNVWWPTQAIADGSL
jgi:PhnB protein